MKRLRAFLLGGLGAVLLTAGCQTMKQPEKVQPLLVFGYVIYADSTAVPNAEVYTDPPSQRHATDEKGMFESFELPRPMEYTFIAEVVDSLYADKLVGRTTVEVEDGQQGGIYIVIGTEQQMKLLGVGEIADPSSEAPPGNVQIKN